MEKQKRREVFWAAMALDAWLMMPMIVVVMAGWFRLIDRAMVVWPG